MYYVPPQALECWRSSIPVRLVMDTLRGCSHSIILPVRRCDCRTQRAEGSSNGMDTKVRDCHGPQRLIQTRPDQTSSVQSNTAVQLILTILKFILASSPLVSQSLLTSPHLTCFTSHSPILTQKPGQDQTPHKIESICSSFYLKFTPYQASESSYLPRLLAPTRRKSC